MPRDPDGTDRFPVCSGEILTSKNSAQDRVVLVARLDDRVERSTRPFYVTCPSSAGPWWAGVCVNAEQPFGQMQNRSGGSGGPQSSIAPPDHLSLVLRWSALATNVHAHPRIFRSNRRPACLRRSDRPRQLRLVCKRRRETVALGGRKVQRLAWLNGSLERYREERAKLARLDRLEREQLLIPRDEVRDGLGRIASVLRSVDRKTNYGDTAGS